ncbi:MAG: hypothetical protein ABI946_00635 [Chthoniobacterales bacterium]
MARLLRYSAVVLGVIALSGCSIFSGKPALPRHAAIETRDAPSAGTDYVALVANAEVVYFPAERAAFGGRSEPSARLLDAFRQNGAPFAIGWDLLDASQQPLLDELQASTGNAREEVIRRLEMVGNGRAREHCRAVLRDERLVGLRHVALGCLPVFLAKLETRERLTLEEEKQLPRGYTTPPGALEAYNENSAPREAPARSYRGQVVAQQFAAEQIVRHLRAAGMQSKLLVFLRASDLEAGLGVPRYVAQKLPVRQLVLDSSGTAPTRAKLLTDL